MELGHRGARPHRTLPGSVLEVFQSMERPAMRPLPEEPFEIAHWAKAKLHPDCQLQVSGRFFTAPHRHVGKQLDVCIGERVARIYDGGELVKTHAPPGERRYVDPPTIRRPRSPSCCAPRPGAGIAPPSWARRWWSWSMSCWAGRPIL